MGIMILLNTCFRTLLLGGALSLPVICAAALAQ
jgi:hypothetical protein